MALMFDCMVYGLSFNIRDVGDFIGDHIEREMRSEVTTQHGELWQTYRKHRPASGSTTMSEANVRARRTVCKPHGVLPGASRRDRRGAKTSRAGGLAKIVFRGTLLGFFLKDAKGDPAILICPDAMKGGFLP
jgi:hypothetical protein